MALDGLGRGRGDGWFGWRGDGDSGLFLRSRWPLQSSYSLETSSRTLPSKGMGMRRASRTEYG